MIFVYDNYRKALEYAVNNARSVNPQMNFQRIAEKTKIPQSYVSRVMNEGADFSADQLFKICEVLQTSEEETDYMLLLLDYSRCQHARRKQAVLRKIRATQRKHSSTEKVVSDLKAINSDNQDLEEYYYDPWHQIIHIALSIPRYRTNVSLLASDFNISAERLRQIITTLERLGIISRSKTGEINSIARNLHLERSARVYNVWRDQIRQISLHHLRQLDPDDFYSLSTTFSGDEATCFAIKMRFLAFLEEAKQLIGEAKDTHCYQINFDLFSWN